MRVLLFFVFVFCFVCENIPEDASVKSDFPLKKSNCLDGFEITTSNDQTIICKIHAMYISTDVASAKNLAIKKALIESIRKTATAVFFQNDSQYTDSIKENEFDEMLKAIKSFKIENENMYDDNSYEANFIVTIDKKILSMNSFALLKKYLKSTEQDTTKGTSQQHSPNNVTTPSVSNISAQDLNMTDNSVNVVYKSQNAISKWLREIKNKFDKANIKYNLKEMSANELKIEIISENIKNTVETIQSIGFSVIKENDTLILTEIGI